jgi:hypothetical protein
MSLASVETKFVGFLETAGKDFEKGLAFVVKEAPVVDPLIAVLFPSAAPVAAEATTAVNLIQNAVLEVEQKYAASGVQAGTGAQKSAEVLTLVGPAVTSLLTAAKIPASAAYIQSLVTAVVGVLNAQQAVAA